MLMERTGDEKFVFFLQYPNSLKMILWARNN